MLLEFRERLVQVSAINRNYHLSDQSSPSFTIATCFLNAISLVSGLARLSI